MSVTRRINAFLDLAEQDVHAAKTLAVANNRYAAYHCQQAIEKLIKAVLLRRGIASGTEHRLDTLVDAYPVKIHGNRSFVHSMFTRPMPRPSDIPRQEDASWLRRILRESLRMPTQSQNC